MLTDRLNTPSEILNGYYEDDESVQFGQQLPF
jgi:hypothetical protein